MPIPVWYPLGADGAPDYERPIVAAPETLPVDPMTDAPPGYAEAQRGKPGGFAGEADIFDTWFTSSLTPQIGSGWRLDPGRHAQLFPAELRPQSHEIIRTWAFYTIAKALLHENSVPWHHVAISGWILDPDRKKMSKSLGNVVTPMPIIEQFGADTVRYWAGSARLGVDTAFDENVLRVGKRLATKLWNASKFVLTQTGPDRPDRDGARSGVRGGAGGARHPRDGRLRALRARGRAEGGGELLLDALHRHHARAGEDARARRGRRRAAPPRWRRCGSASTCCCACSRRSFPT